MATYRVQKSRSTLPSRVQPILTSALTHYQNNFRKLNVNQMRFSMTYQNTQDLYDTHIIFELLACLTPGFHGHENVLSKENLVLDLPTKLTTEPVLWTWPKLSSSSSTLRVFWFIRLKNINIDRRWFLRLNYSKFFLHNEKVIGLVAKPAVDAVKKK